ncbi:MAG: flagellar hook-associated protein FlgK [Opitutae bacterium]|nr:flagellar hook-associated protein FlgK [Opitutae bacterium]
MSGLFSSLNASVKALTAQSRGIEMAGKNLANVNNTAYARQRVLFGDRGTVQTPEGAQSLGLEALGIQQLRDTLLDRQVLREVALKSGYEMEQQILQRAQASLGQSVGGADAAGTGSSGGSGIGGALDDFFNAFQGLASRPTDTGERQTLLQKVDILTDRLRLADNRLAQTQADIDTQIQGDVDEANLLLQAIADLNTQIGRAEIGHPGSAVDLRDQRQAKLEELSAKLPIEVRSGTNGMVNVVLKDASSADVVLVNDNAVTGPVTFTGTGFTGGSPATALAISSGSVAVALATRDGAVQDVRDRLDTLAHQLVVSVNAAYNPTSVPGADFFDPAGITAATITRLSGITAANLKAGTGAAGDNSIATAVAAVGNQVFATSGGDFVNGTISQHYNNTVSNLGQALSTANSRAEDQFNIEKIVRSQRDGVSGVSLDEEMADLVKYQRAFQASSRVFSVIDELLDTVVNSLGR